MKRFNEGDTVYFVASSIFVRKAKVVRNAGGFCTIIFDGDGNCVAYDSNAFSPSERNEYIKIGKLEIIKKFR